MVWLLVACAAVVVAAGAFLAARRPGPTLADDEVAELPENQTEGHPSA
jgi:hypothetical protein